MMEISTRPSTDVSHDISQDPAKSQVSPVEYLLQQAKVLYAHNDYSLALALLRQASALDSTHFQVLNMMAEIAVLTGKRDEAVKIRQVLKSNYPNFSTFFAYAQELYLSEIQDEEALKAYFECLSLVEAEQNEMFEIYKNMGNISVKLRDFEGAEEFYNKAYTINIRSDVLLVNFGTLEVQRNDWDKALFCFREAVKINPKNDKAWVGLGLMHNEYGDHSLAWANLNMALEINPFNRTGVLMFARWALRDRQEFAAISTVEKFLSKENFDEELSLILVHLYCCVNMFQKAEMEATKIMAWNPQLPAAREIQKHIKQLQGLP
jgi:tetratricopeptide (TPR) repeat protein